ncbi:MAG: VanW family protein [Ruminococcus sp.]|nr:VanW family protein [Ruminococcus sp.]
MKMRRFLCIVMAVMLFLGIVMPVGAEETAEEAPIVLEAEAPEQMIPEETASEIQLDTGTSNNTITADNRILDNVYLESVDLSGMNAQEAAQAAEKRMEEISGYQIWLYMDDQSVSVSAKDLGVSGDYEQAISYASQLGQNGNVISRYKTKKDLEVQPLQLELEYKADEEVIRQALQQNCLPLNREVSNYDLVRDGSSFTVVKGQRGVVLKEEESVQRVKTYLTEEWKDGVGSVDLVVDITEPKGSEEQLSKVQSVLGQGSTDYSSSSSNRAQNIKNATQMINGTVVYPGESFSVCQTIRPFTEENGYLNAPSYANGEVVDSLGGGICQVSTTLYLAVLRAELEVTERHNHSMIVKYVKPSMDAAIADGAKDFQFVNNLETPIYIEGYAGGGNLGFVIYGEETRPEGRTVTYKSETLETIEPDTILTADSELAFGSMKQTQSAHTGYRAKLVKIVTENGTETTEDVNSSYYRMTENKYSVGIKTENAEAAAAMQAAIDANDLNQVYVVLNQYGAL